MLIVLPSQLATMRASLGHARALIITCGSKKKSKPTTSAQTPKTSLKYRVERGGLTLEHIPASLANRTPSVALAYTYLGDAVWELYARQHMILKRLKDDDAKQKPGVAIRPQDGVSKGWCSASAMHAHLSRLLERNVLKDEELAVLKWGRDFGHESRPGHKGEEHRDASALEALVAYLYLFDSERLHEVLSECGMTFCSKPLNGLGGIETAVMEAMDSL